MSHHRHHGLNAKRFEGKPLKQPAYNFRSIPQATKRLENSICEEVTESAHREYFQESMSEIVLLCNEAIRRNALLKRKKKKGYSKPLSLEYIADRMDVDDPLWGYYVRHAGEHRQLQGFVTVTTFTNWQKTFRWDSMHDSAFSYDDDDLAREMAQGVRKYDQDGRLAQELQATVRCGDPWNEGIVWPRIAEISLLGALGCGKTLLSLAIERLERMNATSHYNYDYVVLQATDNSIPFYESMGFIRVGGITEDYDFLQKQKQKQKEQQQQQQKNTKAPTTSSIQQPSQQHSKDDDNNDSDSDHPESEIVSCPVQSYTVKKNGETPHQIAKKFKVHVWDIIFLNKDVYRDIGTTSRLLKGTRLFIPDLQKTTSTTPTTTTTTNNNSQTQNNPEAPQWYITNNNDTPRMISKMFNVNCAELVKANRERLPELLANSRLMPNTRIKVSHFHIHDDQHVPYCHWTFPDDTLETSEPSYMMARRLHKQHSGKKKKERPVEQSLAIPITPYKPPVVPAVESLTTTATTTATTTTTTTTTPALNQSIVPHDNSSRMDHSCTTPAVPTTNNTAANPTSATATPKPKSSKKKKKNKPQQRHPDEPQPPKRPLSAYFLFSAKHRPEAQKLLPQKASSHVIQYLSSKWKELSLEDRKPYQDLHDQMKQEYVQLKETYQQKLKEFQQKHPELYIQKKKEEEEEEESALMGYATATTTSKQSRDPNQPVSLFNKVVKLDPSKVQNMLEVEYPYYYVLTYIPDLQWCHLAPMKQVGTFGPDRPKAEGRPIWMLVHENQGKELDVSAQLCEVVRSRSMRRTVDADTEQWDIPPPLLLERSNSSSNSSSSSMSSSRINTTTNHKRTKVKVRVNGSTMPECLPLATPPVTPSKQQPPPLSTTVSSSSPGVKITSPVFNASLAPSKVPKRGRGRPPKTPPKTPPTGSFGTVANSSPAVKIATPIFTKSLAPSKVPKRGRGRPPKTPPKTPPTGSFGTVANSSPAVKIATPIFTKSLAPSKVPKRGRGRPPKTPPPPPPASPATPVAARCIANSSPAIKRGRGRPPKTPPKSDVAAADGSLGTSKMTPPELLNRKMASSNGLAPPTEDIQYNNTDGTKSSSSSPLSTPTTKRKRDPPPKINSSSMTIHQEDETKPIPHRTSMSVLEISPATAIAASSTTTATQTQTQTQITPPKKKRARLEIPTRTSPRKKSANVTMSTTMTSKAHTAQSSPPPSSPPPPPRNYGPFKVGDVVKVESRTWPGVNKPGGVARISKVHLEDQEPTSDNNNNNSKRAVTSYDVAYVLGGREKNVDSGFVYQEIELDALSPNALSSPRTNSNHDNSRSSTTKRSTRRLSRHSTTATTSSSSLQDTKKQQPSTESSAKRNKRVGRSRKSNVSSSSSTETPQTSSLVNDMTIEKENDNAAVSSKNNGHTRKRKLTQTGSEESTHQVEAVVASACQDESTSTSDKDGSKPGTPVRLNVSSCRNTSDGGKRTTPVRKAAPLFGGKCNAGVPKNHGTSTTSDMREKPSSRQLAPMLALDQKANDIFSKAADESSTTASDETITGENHKPLQQRLAPIFTKNLRKTTRCTTKPDVTTKILQEKGGINSSRSSSRSKRSSGQAANMYSSSSPRKKGRNQSTNKQRLPSSPLLLGARREARVTRAAA